MIRILSIVLFGMVFFACAAGVPSGNEHKRSVDPQIILDKIWQWESTITPVDKITVPDPERFTIRLTADGRAQVRFVCNHGGGEFKISPGKLSFGPLLSTRMACPPGSLDSSFMRDLQRVVSFFVDKSTLYLELPYDSGTMKFRLQE
ncbi:MAG: META domain-containing protein [Desulfobacterales bacterium]|nr:MAG: META domain-containing protein [Desulfobacterales bacterium]